MAAELAMVAAGIMAVTQPVTQPISPAEAIATHGALPVAIDQDSIEPWAIAPLAAPPPEAPHLAAAPEFSPAGSAGPAPTESSIAAVQADEAGFINEQLGRSGKALPQSPGIAIAPSQNSLPALAVNRLGQMPVTAPITRPGAAPQSNLGEKPRLEGSGAIARQEAQFFKGEAQAIAENIPLPGMRSGMKPGMRPGSSPGPIPGRPPEVALAPLPGPAPASIPAIAPSPLSPERQILAQVMMDSAEARFLEESGWGDLSVPANPLPSSPSASDSTQGDALGQLTSVSQLRDVQPTDWAYQATQTLIERYGCTAGYPDGSFRGNRTLSRYEFAAGLNACLERVIELLPVFGVAGEIPHQEDLAVAQQLAEQFEAELSQIRGRADRLEQRQADLETQQFSTTTKLHGQTIFGLRGSNTNDVDLFPVDGNPERSGAGEVTLGGSAELTLATSFRGNDLMLATLQAGNIAASAPTQFTNMGRLAYENDTDNQLVLSDLSYRFAAAPNLGVIVGSHGVNPANTFRGMSPLEGSGDGALSRLGQRNPILELGGGSGGAGFDWQLSPSVSLQGIYSATSPNQTGNNLGLFNGGYVAGGQLSAGLGQRADLGIHYLHSYSPNGSLGTGMGDAQVLSPFAPTESSFRTHAVGGTAAWRPSRSLTLGGWGGWTSSTPTDLSGSVQTTNWMGFVQVNDLFQRGNALGLLLGQPPKITSSNLPVGFNLPEFSDGGGRGGRRDTALHLEAFYRAQLNEQISVTPGIVLVRNPNHNADNDTLVVGAMRTTFRF